jgi:hypothetical protein
MEFVAKENQCFVLIPQSIVPSMVPDEVIENEVELPQDGTSEDDEAGVV